MHFLLTRLTDERHRVEVIRADGTREKLELETRGVLLHDFVHYAIESIAGMTSGYFGTLAAGAALQQVNDRGATWDPDSQVGLAESIAGPMQDLVRGLSDSRAVLATLDRMFSATRKQRPEWISSIFIGQVEREYRRLDAAWKTTPAGGQLLLVWPPPKGKKMKTP